ncbi:TonB-dependent receptor [Candidatus Parabeggiatoa sp. HSG14]|uniref:TonB-dependent receptor plug domain-containing protein n=1 Tax=Candidatus Parabeggiatoa sp. HSG14 TaxID=3055593 RepID=UPI0025A76535|nr:TonB-dependent receptor [Thiotrichales bacterium HSG14]
MKKLIENLKRARLILASLLVLIALSPLASSLEESEEYDVFSEISLGELMDIEKYMVSIATKTEMTTQEAPSIVSVITGEEIKNRGARNIVDVLRMVPGFDMTNSIIVPEHQINIRGLSSSVNNSKVKIMINGHNTGIFDGSINVFLDTLPVDHIKRIEIIRGPGSALYGTGAFIGVINIITKDGGDGPSTIALEGGSYDTVKPHGRFSYKNNDLKVSLYADYYSTKGYDGFVESDRATNSPVLASHTPGRLTSDKDHISIHADVNYNNWYVSGFFQDINANSPTGAAKVLSDENDLDYIYAYTELGYKQPIKNKGHWQARFFYDYAKANNTFEIFPEETAKLPVHTGFPEGEGLYGNPRVNNSILGSEMTMDYKVHSAIQLVGGASYEYIKQSDVEHYTNYNVTGKPLEVNGVTYPGFPYQWFPFQDISENGNFSIDIDRTVMALYTQGIFDVKKLLSLDEGVKNLSLTAGVRYDHYDDFGSSINPRLGLVYAPITDLWFKVLYGTAFRAPSFKELYRKNNPSNIGNPELEPETMTSLEGLIGYNFTKHIKGSLTYFSIKADDQIQVSNKHYVNIGKMESQGIEAEMQFLFEKQNYAYFNATFQNVKDTTGTTISSTNGQHYTQADYNPGNMPKFIANAGINYNLSRYLLANVSLNYVGERDRSEAKKWNGEALVRADQRDPVRIRTLLNTSLTFRNFYPGMEFQFSVFNLLDEDHRDPDPQGALKYDMPEQGRWFMGRFSYAF